MSIGRIGGTLFVGGAVLFMIAAGGGTVGIGARDVHGHPVADLGVLLVTAPLILVGSGAAVLAIAGPSPLSGLGTRSGLGTLAIGLFSLPPCRCCPSSSPWRTVVSGGGEGPSGNAGGD